MSVSVNVLYDKYKNRKVLRNRYKVIMVPQMTMAFCMFIYEKSNMYSFVGFSRGEETFTTLSLQPVANHNYNHEFH